MKPGRWIDIHKLQGKADCAAYELLKTQCSLMTRAGHAVWIPRIEIQRAEAETATSIIQTLSERMP